MSIRLDLRLGGEPRYVEVPDEEKLMVIPDEIRKCVCFIGYRNASNEYRELGTAFFVSKRLMEGLSAVYTVTAAHVLETLARLGLESFALRVNTKADGTIWLDVPLGRHWPHPTDPTADVVVLPPVQPFDKLDHRSFPLSSIWTDELAKKHGYGVGDEVFFPGLFGNHSGRKRAIPIVRTGTIAALPDEPVETKRGPIDAYLVDTRSIGGLSGSPVFAYPGFLRLREKQVVAYVDGSPLYLLGLMHGHYNVDDKPQEANAVDEDARLTEEKLNSGIAIVVPVAKVMEILDGPDIRKLEEKAVEDKKRDRLPEPDVIVEEGSGETFTKDDFEDALKRVSRKLSDEEKSGT